MARLIFSIFLIICFSQCQEVAENTLIASPNEVADSTKFPGVEYAYIKTYSMNRTWDLDSLFDAYEQEEDNRQNPDTVFQAIKDGVVGGLWIGELSILNSEKEMAKTAQFIKKLNNFEMRKLQNILIEEKDEWGSYTLCVHKYRDALIFYNKKDKPVACINICFSCIDIYGEEKGLKTFEDDNWEQLEQLFIDFGHPISEDEY